MWRSPRHGVYNVARLASPIGFGKRWVAMATIRTRYGYSELVSDPDDPWITRKLITELRSEQFDEPDDEHTQVSVANEHWAVTAQVSGRITCDNLDALEGEESNVPQEMYLRDIPDEQLIGIWRAVARLHEFVASLPLASWNQIGSWLRRIDGLRRAV